MKLHGLVLAVAATTAAQAQSDAPTVLDEVTVTATRVASSSANIPASINLVRAPESGMGVNLSEWLGEVPGLLARDRQNYAQDTQISLRGFGARAAFGIRGIRLFLDGIPATQPDGQGQIAHFNLATADRVEVLRGPFSALYGNSSGGVIQLFSADGSEQPKVQFESALGSYGTQRESLGYQGPFGDTRVTLGYTHFETDGYRNHSSAQRDSINSKFNFLIGSAGKLSLVVNYYDSPYAQDPLGLSWAQVQQNRRQATPTASQFDSRKSTGQSQLGLVYQRDFGTPGLLQVSSYGGQRQVLQFLAIPVVTQSNPRHSGGVVDLSSDYFGSDARWTWKHDVLGRPLTLVGGLNGETLRQHRRGYENFQGSTLGVQGKLRRDEIDTVTSLDQYLQVDWLLTSRWSLDAGLRHSEVHFRSDDHYVTAQNPNDSGRVRYGAFTPVAGLLWRATDTAHFYLSYGTGFETPTFAELAYRPDGSAGLNFDLHAARSRNAELGGKFRLAYATRLDAAIFRADSRNELVTVTNSGGRATFANATRTRRQGAELSLTSSVLRTLDFTLAATLLDAAVREGYVTCTTAPCTTPQTVVARGNQLPGVAQGQIATRLSWSPTPAWSGAIEYRYLDAVPVNDTNSEAAPSYGVVDLATRYTLHNQQWKLTASLRIDNLLAEHYIGSVIVNDGNGRFYEPAPGRSLVAGLTLSFAP